MPDVHAAEPIPEAARAALARLFETGDLFRYTSEDAPVAQCRPSQPPTQAAGVPQAPLPRRPMLKATKRLTSTTGGHTPMSRRGSHG